MALQSRRRDTSASHANLPTSNRTWQPGWAWRRRVSSRLVGHCRPRSATVTALLPRTVALHALPLPNPTPLCPGEDMRPVKLRTIVRGYAPTKASCVQRSMPAQHHACVHDSGIW